MPWTFYNSNGQRLSSAATNISVLDIDGATDIGAAIVDADLFIVDDGAGGTNRKTAASRLKTYIGAAATQAEMEAASSNTVFATPGRTQNHPGVAKAWCVRARAGSLNSGDYNVASITDSGTGDSIIVIDTDFADANYVVIASEMDSVDNIVDPHVTTANIAAGQFQLEIRNTSNSATDAAFGIACFGDQ